MRHINRDLRLEWQDDDPKSHERAPGKLSKTPKTSCSNRKTSGRSTISTTPNPKKHLKTEVAYFETTLRKGFAVSCAAETPEKSTKRRSKSKSHSPCFNSMISQKQALQKVAELKQWGTQHKLRQTEMQLKARQDERKMLQDRPVIGEGSKELYKSVRQRKHLSGNLLQRFEQYEQEKVQHHLDNIILQHFEETHSVPSLKSLLRSHRDELVRLLRNCSKQELRPNNHQ